MQKSTVEKAKLTARETVNYHPRGLLAVLLFLIVAVFSRYTIEFAFGALLMYILVEVWWIEEEMRHAEPVVAKRTRVPVSRRKSKPKV